MNPFFHLSIILFPLRESIDCLIALDFLPLILISTSSFQIEQLDDPGFFLSFFRICLSILSLKQITMLFLLYPPNLYSVTTVHSSFFVVCSALSFILLLLVSFDVFIVLLLSLSLFPLFHFSAGQTKIIDWKTSLDRITNEEFERRYGMRNSEVKEGDEIMIEVDVRSEEKEKRTAHLFINGIQQPLFFCGLPERLYLRVSSLSFSFFILFLLFFSMFFSIV